MARRRPHAAARSRIAATVLSVAVFAAIGRAIDLASNTTVGAVTSAKSASTTSLPSGATSAATASTASHKSTTTTTAAVTTTHAS